MSVSTQRPGGARRLAAFASIVLVLAVVVATLVRVVTDPLRVVVQLLLLVVFLGAAWIALTRAAAKRVVAIVIAAAAAVALFAAGAGPESYAVISLLVRIAALVVAVETRPLRARGSPTLRWRTARRPARRCRRPPGESCS